MSGRSGVRPLKGPDPAAHTMRPGVERGGVILALEGPSGVGKSTIATVLARRLRAHRIAEAYRRLRPPGRLVFRSARELERIERRLLREERARWSEAQRARRRGETVVLDTGPIGPYTYLLGLAAEGEAPTALVERIGRTIDRSFRAGTLGWPDVVVWLRAADRLVRRRNARARRTHPRALERRHAAVARWEARFWRTAASALGLCFAVVRATGPPDAVAERVERVALRLLARRPRGGRRRRPPGREGPGEIGRWCRQATVKNAPGSDGRWPRSRSTSFRRASRSASSSR